MSTLYNVVLYAALTQNEGCLKRGWQLRKYRGRLNRPRKTYRNEMCNIKFFVFAFFDIVPFWLNLLVSYVFLIIFQVKQDRAGGRLPSKVCKEYFILYNIDQFHLSVSEQGCQCNPSDALTKQSWLLFIAIKFFIELYNHRYGTLQKHNCLKYRRLFRS